MIIVIIVVFKKRKKVLATFLCVVIWSPAGQRHNMTMMKIKSSLRSLSCESDQINVTEPKLLIYLAENYKPAIYELLTHGAHFCLFSFCLLVCSSFTN